MSNSIIRVGFIGNPNCGKTTLFNAYTGANLKVANWPGVTVEKKEGRTEYKGQEFQLIDLPGIGETLADRLLEYRAQNGPFTDWEELTRVQGIGVRTVEGLRTVAYLGP